MKLFFLTRFPLVFVLGVSALISANAQDKKWEIGLRTRSMNISELRKSYDEDFRKNGIQKGYKDFARKNWLATFATDTLGNIDIAYITNEYQDFIDRQNKTFSRTRTSGLPKWRMIGPQDSPKTDYFSGNTISQGKGIGRVSSIALHPTNDRIIYVSSDTGGLFKSEDGGESWVSLSDSWPNLLAMRVFIHQQSPETIYIQSSGQNMACCSNASWVKKSLDGGKTWKELGFSTYSLSVNPKKGDFLHALDYGRFLYSSNGGLTMESVSGLPIENFRGNERVAYDAIRENVLYIAAKNSSNYNDYTYALYQSEDYGKSFSKVEDLNIGEQVNEIKIYTTPLFPNEIFLVPLGRFTKYENTLYNYLFEGVYRRNLVTGETKIMLDPGKKTKLLGVNYASEQYLYNHLGYAGGSFNMIFDSKIPDHIIIGNQSILETFDGGNSFYSLTASNEKNIHVDIQDIEQQSITGDMFIVCDGGVYIRKKGVKHFDEKIYNLSIAQSYRMSQSYLDSSTIAIGNQDTGTAVFDGKNWADAGGGDGMESDFNSVTNSFLSTYQEGGVSYKDKRILSQGLSISSQFPEDNYAVWITPVSFIPADPTSILVGRKELYLSRNEGTNWERLSNFGDKEFIRKIIVPAQHTNYLYLNRNQKIYQSKDFGKNWAKLFESSDRVFFDVDSNNPDMIYVATNEYVNGRINPSVRTINNQNGQQIDITSNLPKLNIWAITHQAGTDGGIYLAMERGVYYKNNSMPEWILINEGLPNLVVSDLKIHYNAGKLRASTYGRGAWETDLYEKALKVEKPVAVATGGCDGSGKVNLSGQDGYSKYFWYEDGKYMQEGQSISVSKSGKYSLVVWKKNHPFPSPFSDVLNVDVVNTKSFELQLQSAAPLCIGNSATLKTEEKGSTYEWYAGTTLLTNNNTSSLVISKSAEYRVVIKNEKGCAIATSTPKLISFNPNPATPIINASSKTICTSETVTLESNLTAAKYTWYLNDKQISVGQKQFTTSEAGEYSVSLADNNGCESGKSLKVSIQKIIIEKPTITYSPDGLLASHSSNYQWFKNGVELAGEIKEILQNIDAGAYSVKISDGKCSAVSDSYLISATQVLSDKIVKVFPNPSKGRFWVELPNNSLPYSIEVYDLAGKQLYRKSFSGSSGKVEVELKVANGEYILKTSLGAASYHLKFLISE